ncbi:hypothetical protein HMPREF1981_00478 [Bacteroides pyogenes F0041]|uniref:Uncharacterized protein n=1 Tax=Bacteroides pyogenes F0041 TaxID=1321819 RepID=U2CVF5_9BACE|nr:hypothetical protein HMPREF1981_00478 [Bacteroides pyogenes F0041]
MNKSTDTGQTRKRTFHPTRLSQRCFSGRPDGRKTRKRTFSQPVYPSAASPGYARTGSKQGKGHSTQPVYPSTTSLVYARAGSKRGKNISSNLFVLRKFILSLQINNAPTTRESSIACRRVSFDIE